MPTPTVTVIIPTRDRWSLAARAAACALHQRDVTTEVIVVDDGSLQPAPREGPLSDRRVRIVRRPTSRGLGAARNTGVAEARTRWVAFLDDDDLWAPAKLGSQLLAAESRGAELAYCAAYFVDPDLRVRALQGAPSADALPAALLESNAIPAAGSNMLVTRDVMTRSGGFDESFHQLVDWDLSLRLSDAAAVAAVDEPLVAYTQHAGNMATTSAKSLLPEWRRLRRKHRALARRRGGRLRSDYVLPWYVWRLQLGGRRWRAATIGTVWGARLRNAELARAAVSGLRAGTPPPPAYRGVRSRSHPRQASRSGERPWLPSPSDTLPWLHAAEAGPAATQDQATGRRSSELIDSAEMQPDFAETQEHQRRREASWARAARQIERSRSWRAGSFLVGTFRLLTSRRPASPRGPAELAASIEEHIHFANAQPAVPETQEHQRRREASWARAARQIERSRTWRVGSFLVGAFRLLTFRRPALPQGPAELAASIESFTLEPPRNGCR